MGDAPLAPAHVACGACRQQPARGAPLALQCPSMHDAASTGRADGLTGCARNPGHVARWHAPEVQDEGERQGARHKL